MISMRAWQLQDAQAFYEIGKDPCLHNSWNHQYLYPSTIQDAHYFIHSYTQANPKRFYTQVILYNYQICGCIQAEVKDFGKAELSYYLISSVHNKGIMTTILPIFCRECFFGLPVHILYARVKKENIASQKVLRKCNFIEQEYDTIYVYQYHKCCKKQ